MMTIPFYFRTTALVLLHLLSGDCGREKQPQEKQSIVNHLVKVDKHNPTNQAYKPGNIPLKNMFGINAYEWNFQEDPKNPNDRSKIYEANMTVLRSFSAVRHYLSWNKLEYSQGSYTYNPTHDGGWNYDMIYTRCKQDGIFVLADIKDCPNWLMNTYPTGLRDVENVPAPYGADRGNPSSYVAQGRAAFQFAARYGYKIWSAPLIRVDSHPRWPNDPPNETKTGLGLIRYVECDNERDKWWKSEATKQSPEEYAANMSAFYDGDKGKLGPDVGVKQGDPGMQVVMGGLATADINFVKRMVAWCIKHRGYKPNGEINLCFDVINYHLYSNNGNLTHSQASTGIAPELSTAGNIADEFVSYANTLKQQPEVWVTETGYDINQQSNQKAPPVGSKPPMVTQADWILRTSLLYIRHGVKRLFFYQLQDDQPGGTTQYATSGLSADAKRRPAADYLLQVGKLMGNFRYQGTISTQPTVDKYTSEARVIYILTVPDQRARTVDYTLDLGKAKSAFIYNLAVGDDSMAKAKVITKNGKLSVKVTETPLFVEANN